MIRPHRAYTSINILYSNTTPSVLYQFCTFLSHFCAVRPLALRFALLSLLFGGQNRSTPIGPDQ